MRHGFFKIKKKGKVYARHINHQIGIPSRCRFPYQTLRKYMEVRDRAFMHSLKMRSIISEEG